LSQEIEYPALETSTVVEAQAADLHRLEDVPVELAVEIGRTHMTIGETLALGPGSIVSLNRLAGEPVDLLVIDEEFGLRLTEVVSPARRLREAEGSLEQ
jgi:flagellar motor switch protein FliN/FliY